MIFSPISKSILFIVPYPLGSAPSQRFRFEQYFEILKKHNYTFDTASFWSEKGWSLLYKPKHTFQKAAAFISGIAGRFMLLLKVHNYETIFIHREAMPIGPPIIEFLLINVFWKRIIYDFDDAIWLPNTSEQNSIAGKLKFHRKVKYICGISRKVSCGNGFLAAFAQNYNDKVYINTTTIDTAYHRPEVHKKPKEFVTIGWTGTHSTTKYLNQIVPVLQELIKAYPIKILVISDQAPDWDIQEYEFVKWSKESETNQLRRMDIGIMPLDDTIWEKGKCGFKALQYMATGIPAVVSDVGVNKEIIDHGVNGFLCTSLKDWSKNLIALVQSEELRNKIGEQGRKKVIDSYSVLSNETLFLSLFE